MERAGFFQRKFWIPLLSQMKQGTSPEKLAWSVAAGGVLSTFPILGATTTLCALAGVSFRLNHIVLQLVNYLMTPVQLMAIPLFIHGGESLFGLPHISFNPVRLGNELWTAPGLFFLTYGASALSGIAVWLVLAPLALYGVRLAFLPVLRRKERESAG